MFRCERCQSLVPPDVPVTRLIAETRPVIYPRRPGANRKSKKGIKPDDAGGRGFEIVRELNVCPDCANS